MIENLRRRLFAAGMPLLLGLLAIPALGQNGPDAALATLIRQADTAFRAGYAAMQAGDLEGARTDFALTVKLAPQLPEAHAALGAILMQLGNPQEAIPELEETLELEKAQNRGDESAQANLALAYQAVGLKDAVAGNLDQATVELRKSFDTTQDPALQSQLQDQIGSLLANQKRWPEAQAAFREAIRLSADGPTAGNAHMHLGVALAEQKQYEEALTELGKAVELVPNNAPANALAQFQLGRVLALVGMDEQAVPHLEAATRGNPAPMGAVLELAMAEQRLGKQEEAIPLFQQAVALDPHNPTALANLGLALTQTGKAKEALPIYQRALAETPNDPVAHQDLGVAYLQQSDFDGAIAQFEKAQELSPSDPHVHYDLGLAYKLKDRMEDAARELQKAASLDPTLPDPPYTLGILYMQTGRLEDAVTQLRAALALRPENGDGWAILGSVLKQLNRRDEAVTALRKAVELLPSQPGPHLTLAGVLAEQGKREEATAERKVAAELSRTAVSRQRATFSTNAGNQLMQRGEIAGAVGRYQEAIVADPSFAEAHRQLAVAYVRQGRTADAAAEQAKAEALDAGPK